MLCSVYSPVTCTPLEIYTKYGDGGGDADGEWALYIGQAHPATADDGSLSIFIQQQHPPSTYII